MRWNNRRYDTINEVYHDYKMKIDLPTYSGKSSIESFLLGFMS